MSTTIAEAQALMMRHPVEFRRRVADCISEDAVEWQFDWEDACDRAAYGGDDPREGDYFIPDLSAHADLQVRDAVLEGADSVVAWNTVLVDIWKQRGRSECEDYWSNYVIGDYACAALVATAEGES